MHAAANNPGRHRTFPDLHRTPSACTGPADTHAQALARVDLNDRTSFGEAVQVVKTYVLAKMKKAKNSSVALPGGKVRY